MDWRKGLSGEEKIGLSGTAALQKYILRCVGPGGSITEEAVVTIVENAPSISIDVNPGDKCSNNRFYTPGPSLIQVKWSTSKPALCTVESDKVASFLTGEIDNLTENGSGSMVIPFDGLSTRITVTCEGGSGTDTKSVTVRGLPVYAASYASDKLRGRCD
jgi:hypothetical protein